MSGIASRPAEITWNVIRGAEGTALWLTAMLTRVARTDSWCARIREAPQHTGNTNTE